MALFSKSFKAALEAAKTPVPGADPTGDPFMLAINDNPNNPYDVPTSLNLDGNEYQGSQYAPGAFKYVRQLYPQLLNAGSPAQSLNLLGELLRVTPYPTYKGLLGRFVQQRPELSLNAIRAQQQLHGIGNFAGQEGILASLQRQRGAQLGGVPTLSGGNGLLQSLALNGNQQALNPTVLKAKK